MDAFDQGVEFKIFGQGVTGPTVEVFEGGVVGEFLGEVVSIALEKPPQDPRHDGATKVAMEFSVECHGDLQRLD